MRSETVQKVQAAIHQLGYHTVGRSSHIGGLALRVVALMPTSDNTFNAKLGENLVRAAGEFAKIKVNLDVRLTDVFDNVAFPAVLRNLINEAPDAVILLSPDTADTREAIDQLASANISVISLVSDVPNSKRVAYVGVDNFAAGQTAGSLMSRFLGGKTGTIGVVVGHLSLRDHLERRSGFEQAFLEARPDAQVVTTSATRDDQTVTKACVSQLISTHPDLVGIYCVGGGNRGVSAAIRAANRRDLVAIGHEMTQTTRRSLVTGVYDAVVAQDYWVEATNAIRTAVAHATGIEDVGRIPRITVNIFLKENLP